MTGFTYTHRVGHGSNLTASQVDANFEAASVAVGAKPDVQAGTLVASTIEAATPTAAIDYVAAQIAAVVVASAPSGLNNFDKVAAAIGDDPAYAVTAAAATTAAANAAALAKSTADSAVSGLANKADAFAEVDLGTGAGPFTLTVASHADRQVTYRGTGASITISPTGATGGKQIWVTHAGPSGTVTFSGVSTSANNRLSIAAGETFNAIFANGGWYSLTPSITGGSSTMGTVTGTGTIGSTLTFTPSAGFIGTYQWVRTDTGANAAGSPTNAATYTTVAGDGGLNIGMRFTLTRFDSNAIAVSSAAPGQVTSFAFGAAGTSTLAYSFSAPGSGGAPTSYTVEYRTPPGSGSYTTWGGHSGTSLSGTITGLASGTTYEGRCTAVNASGSGTPSATDSKATTSVRITFGPDTFSGALDARWTGSPAGWATSGGSLIYSGAGFGRITADCSAGDNTIAVDLDRAIAFGYPTLLTRYLDDNNCIAAQYDDGNNRWSIFANVGGVQDPANFVTDTLDRGGTGANVSRVQLAVVGNLVTFTSTGGSNPGSFSVTMTGISALDPNTKVGLLQNTGKPELLWDNFTLS